MDFYADGLHEFSGERKESSIYVHQGFVYHNDDRNGSTIFRCNKRKTIGIKCKAVIYVATLLLLESQTITVTGEHIKHEADHNLILRFLFEEELKRKSEGNFDDYHEIYKKVRMQERFVSFKKIK